MRLFHLSLADYYSGRVSLAQCNLIGAVLDASSPRRTKLRENLSTDFQPMVSEQ